MSRHRLRLAVLGTCGLIVCAAVVVIVVSVGSSGTPAVHPVTAPAPAPVPSTRSKTAAPVPSTQASGPLPDPRHRAQVSGDWLNTSALRAAVAGIGGETGVAVVPLGDGGTFTTGSLQTGSGWSTMKVPVIMARYRLAEQTGESTSAFSSRVVRAVTASDNDAINSLFSDLEAHDGGLVGASQAVQQVLSDGGDTSTTVNTRVPAGGFSTFGQTQWSLGEGVTFYRSLANGCVDPKAGATFVVNEMGQVESDQSWGIGQASWRGARAYFKGGWGPDPSGGYLVRQFGIVTDAHHHGFVVGVIARPSDGSFGSGTALVSRLADAVAASASASRAPVADPTSCR